MTYNFIRFNILKFAMFGSYSYTNTNNIRVLNTSEIESLDLCKNTRACLDPKKKYG